MKAVLLRKPAPIAERPLTVEETAQPALEDDEILVRVRACGICRTDLHIVEGDLPSKLSPVIPGHQIVGEVVSLGRHAKGFLPGERVGVAWLYRTCSACRYCLSGCENLCENPLFTGWTVNGGYAEYAVVPSGFAYHLPDGFDDLQAAPLLCAGIIGYRALRLAGIAMGASSWAGVRLGLYGFGAAGHVVIQIAAARGAEVYVCTRDRERHQTLAAELGAKWVGGAMDAPPVKLDASIVFAPAGELVPSALLALDKGGALILGGIHMSPIPRIEYSLLYGERSIKSVANNTRRDGVEFLAEAARIPIRTHVVTYPLQEANEALLALKTDAIRGAGVLVVDWEVWAI